MRSLRTSLFFVFASCIAGAQEPAAVVKREVEALFSALTQSGCEFNRNGTWYDAKEAADHLRGKYDYLMGKGLVATTESFIERAASTSSMSGKAYQVRCGANPAVESKAWFTQQLQGLRGAK